MFWKLMPELIPEILTLSVGPYLWWEMAFIPRIPNNIEKKSKDIEILQGFNKTNYNPSVVFPDVF